MDIILINDALFIENSPIKEDTIVAKFAPFLAIAQKLYVERILGKPLTDELKAQVKAASREGAKGDEITPQNQALILAIAPVLSFYAVYQGLPFHWAAIVNKGVTVAGSENSNAVNSNDLAQLRRWCKDDAEELGRSLIEFLCLNRADYPLWQPGRGRECGQGGDGSTESPLDAGIFIPNL